MRNYTFVLAVLLLVAGCSKPQQDFKGKEYSLIQAQNGATVTLNFAKDQPRYFGKVVNNYFGTYEIDGSKIKFGPAGATMMMGPEQEMEAEHNFLQILPRVTSYHFVDSTLVLVTNNKQELAFKYIGPSEQ